MHLALHLLHHCNRMVGKLIAWLALWMVVMMTINVGMRYLLQSGAPWQQELVRMMHAVVFLLGAGYAYQQGAHVRIDMLYLRMRAKGKAVIDLLGVLLCLLPFCAALLWFSTDFILSSWNILEGSGEYRGMPGVFLLKSCIWLSALLLLLEGLAVAMRSVMTLRGIKGIH